MIGWDAIAAALPAGFEFAHATPLNGGCINQAWRIEGRNGQRYFVKLNDANKLSVFETESAALDGIATTHTIRVPQVIAHGAAGEHAFLALEYFDLNNDGNARLLGQQLAAMHRNTAEQFGYPHDNMLGGTPQRNGWSSDWIAFWREQRLGFQLELAARNGHGGQLQKMGRELMQLLPQLFGDYRPVPSLLHGDLWGGNHAYLADGTPLLFDPAPYYGDREADLAMTELFGGFAPEFYAAYRAAWPLDAGYATRKILYNLYHILNHANLFGGAYAKQAEGMMQQLLNA